MRYQHVIQSVFAEPWVIIEPAHAIVRRLVETHYLTAGPRAERKAGYDVCGNKVQIEQMQIADGLAIIPVGGVLGHKLTGFERASGAVDYLDLDRELRECRQDDEIQEILLNFDSPGGMYCGCPEVANLINEMDKPCTAYVSGQCCSGAYWIASQCDRILCSGSSEIGSIGCYLALLDESLALAMQGYKVEMFTSGPYKGMGFPGVPLTREQKTMLQARVDEITAEFRSGIGQHREISDKLLQGQSFRGTDAVSGGLADELIPSLSDAIESLGFNSESFGEDEKDSDDEPTRTADGTAGDNEED